MNTQPDRRSTESQAEKSQWAVLGALRFFLALTVVFGHYVYLIGPDTHSIFEGSGTAARSAVWAFFVLSGFSIAASLNRNVSGFYHRRFARIYPLYIAAIMIGLLLYKFHVVPAIFHFPLGGTFVAPKFWIVVSSLMMLQTIFGTILIVWPSWSLSIEWWHYMVAPVLKKMPITFLLTFATLSWWLYIKLTPGPVDAAIDSIQFGWKAFATSWFWLLGFIFYRIRRNHIGIFLLVLAPFATIFANRYIGTPLLLSIFILIVSQDITLSGRWIGIFNWLGDVSYPIYLFHGMVMITAVAMGQQTEPGIVVAVIAISIIVLHCIDYPCRRLLGGRARISASTQQPAMAEK